jgi:hypothetical protein
MRPTARYTRTNNTTNTKIAKIINVSPVLDKLQEYRINYLQNMNRMLP